MKGNRKYDMIQVLFYNFYLIGIPVEKRESVLKEELQFVTGRLILRPYHKKDVDAVWKVVSSPLIYATTAFIPAEYPRKRVEWWFGMLQSAIHNRTGYELGIFLKSNGRYVGNIGVTNVRKENHSASIAYFIDPKLWGQGFATEAAGRMLKFAFEDLKIFRMSGSCMAHNKASRRVMEKLGYQYEGTARAELYKDGKFIDVSHFSLLYPEWVKRQKQKANPTKNN